MATKKNYKTIIFDFDGTVVDTNEIVIQSWQHTYRTLEGKEHPREEIVSTFGEPLWISMERAFPDRDVDECVAIYRGFQKNHFNEEIKLFPGMRELIIELKARDYEVGIVTSRTRDTTINGLNKFGLMDYIDDIVSCDDTDKHKPDPEPVNIALRHFKTEPSQAIMIGDSMFDILCAHNARVKAVLVGWAIAVTDEDKNGPDAPEFFIKEAKDLLDIV